MSHGGGVNAELLLLKKAVSVGSYQHYHLLSGADLPIKTQEQIVSFFEANKPYTFRYSEFDELCESEMFFARKFDASVDSEIINFNKEKVLE